LVTWERIGVYYSDPTEQNKKLIDKILEGEYVMLYGSRASGKSTRTWAAMEKLNELGYICI